MTKLEQLRALLKRADMWSGLNCPACSMQEPAPEVPCYCTDAIVAEDELRDALRSNAASLLDVAEAAHAFVTAFNRPEKDYSGDEVYDKAGGLEHAIAKLEAP